MNESKPSNLWKTPFCQHNHSCIWNIVAGTLNSFGKAFLTKLGINAIIFLLSLKRIKSLKIALQILINKTNFKLGAFMAIQTFFIRSLQCLLRMIRKKEDGWNAFISGSIGGWASFQTLEGQNSRDIFRLYLFSRAADCFYQQQILKGRIEHKYSHSLLIFLFSSMLICYAYFFEPEILPLDTIKMYMRFSLPTLNDKVWHLRNVDGIRRRAEDNGYLYSE